MLLAINVGNTNTALALYEGETQSAVWRLRSDPTRPADEWAALLLTLLARRHWGPDTIDGAICASVVPAVTAALTELADRYLRAPLLVVGPDLNLGLQLLVDAPEAVGPDRIANSVAAARRYGGPCIIVDLGTATTFDVLDANGDFIGGAIAPGLGIAAEAPAARGARLAAVPLVAPAHAIGKNTTEAMQSGIVLGYLELVVGMVYRILSELELNKDAITVIVTGGLAQLIYDADVPIIHNLDPDLTLDGLQMIYELNH